MCYFTCFYIKWGGSYFPFKEELGNPVSYFSFWGARVGSGNLHLDARLDRDGCDLLHNLRGRVQVDEALVDAHLEAVPGGGTLAARRLVAGDAKRLGRQAHRALDLEALVLGALDQVGADLLEVLDVAAGEGDADAVHLDGVTLNLLGLHVGGHLSGERQERVSRERE